MANTHEHEV